MKNPAHKDYYDHNLNSIHQQFASIRSTEEQNDAPERKLNKWWWAQIFNESIGIFEHNFPMHKWHTRLQFHALKHNNASYGRSSWLQSKKLRCFQTQVWQLVKQIGPTELTN